MKHARKVPYAPDLPGTILFTSQYMTVCIFMNINMYIYRDTHIFIRIYLHIYSICSRIYIFMFTNIFICIYTHIYVYIYVHVWIWESLDGSGPIGVGKWELGDGSD